MSFLLDPFLLVGIGIIIAWIAKRKIFYAKDSFFVHGMSLAVLILFYAISISLYCNLEWVQFMLPLVRALGMNARDTHDFMINSGILNIPNSWPETDPYLLAGSIAMFVTYPFFMWLGVVIGRILFGRTPDSTGMIDIFL
ncbi:MAG: hypothetical protein QXL15_01690 [Candidatus Korarchaeota archaeon]